ncbi:MAG: hypothetical protein HYX61_04490 [Gammaproteobacteria bacterium]|jgi:hypothetical protein|nr:hypothetical protein [Gammaproteobacteria bacterium]
MLLNQPSPNTTWTVAKTHLPPKKISTPALERPKLGFNLQGKIDLYILGDRKATTTAVNNPEDLDFSKMSLASGSGIFSKLFEFTDAQRLSADQFFQVGLLYAICQKKGLQPGRTRQIDDAIIRELHELLSDNISNPTEVVAEFVARWNEIAALPYAKNNLDKNKEPQAENSCIFTYHENFEETARAFIRGCFEEKKESHAFKTFMYKVIKAAGMRISAIAEIPQELINAALEKAVEAQLNFIINPMPIDLIAAVKNKSVAEKLETVFDPDKPFDRNKMLSTLQEAEKHNEAKRQIYATHGYEIHQRRGRDAYTSEEQQRARSKSPEPSRDNDIEERKRDRRPG